MAAGPDSTQVTSTPGRRRKPTKGDRITAGGRNITPANLENRLRQSTFISHAVMYGDRRPYPVALLTLETGELTPSLKMKRNVIHADHAELFDSLYT